MFCHHYQPTTFNTFQSQWRGTHTIYIMSKCPELYLSIFIDSLLLINNVHIDTIDLQ